MMIPARDAAMMFEQIIGWPYVSPGSNDERGIDCSGAWVRVYRKYGHSIEHGSNSQYRKHCAQTGAIVGTGDLRVGMMVFKCRPWADSDKGHNQYGQAPGNLYHVGCVTSVNPLRIVHATPPVAKADTKLGSWAYWGTAGKVSYNEVTRDVLYQATVTTSKDPLNIRAQPSTAAAKIGVAPKGAEVDVLSSAGGWAEITYNGLTGYASEQYLVAHEEGAELPPESTGARWGVWLGCDSREQAEGLRAIMGRGEIKQG